MFLSYKWFNLAAALLFFYGCGRIVNVTDPGSNVPPVTPQNVIIAYSQDGSIVVRWDYSSDINIKGYNVYRSVNDTIHLALRSFTTDSYFIDDSLSYDSTYNYKITAVSIHNIESSKSLWVKAKPVNQSPPSVPVFPDINARNWQDSISVYISWRPNDEGDIAGYEIFRSDSPSFNADSTKLVGFSPNYYFVDKKNIRLYKKYYYKVKAVDKGGLKSEASQEVSDMVFGTSETVYPLNSSTVNSFRSFKIKAIGQPARYRIVLQTNEYFGEVWSAEISTDTVNDTISVGFNYPYASSGSTFYWRIITYSRDTDAPNSISNLYNFTIKP